MNIGANSVIISPLEGSLRIGRGARIGAGAVVSQDVPAGATVVSQDAPAGATVVRAPARVLEGPRPSERAGEDQF